jgi:hypothetical protein
MVVTSHTGFVVARVAFVVCPMMVLAGSATSGLDHTGPITQLQTTPQVSSRPGGVTVSQPGTFGLRGGTLPTLNFAIVGDTRPANMDNIAGYPTSIITKIWQDVQALSPRPAFAVTPGNYMFASPTKKPGTQDTQLGYYLTARAAFTNPVFPAMGSDECTGASADNCGPGSTNGANPNYSAYMSKMLGPIGRVRPFYAFEVSGPNKTWTSKFVFVASNAWSPEQARWLNVVLSKPTTYTFIIRNAPTDDTLAPCLVGKGVNNADTIIRQHPYTLLIVGHTHTYAYYPSLKEVIVGNGGAPLSGSVNYGYVVARQQPNNTIVFTEYDYATNAAQANFTVAPS